MTSAASSIPGAISSCFLAHPFQSSRPDDPSPPPAQQRVDLRVAAPRLCSRTLTPPALTLTAQLTLLMASVSSAALVHPSLTSAHGLFLYLMLVFAHTASWVRPSLGTLSGPVIPTHATSQPFLLPSSLFLPAPYVSCFTTMGYKVCRARVCCCFIHCHVLNV